MNETTQKSWDGVNLNQLAESSFQIIVDCAKKNYVNKAPLLDDVSARVLNQMGGYLKFVERLNVDEDESIQREFTGKYLPFMCHKTEPYGLYTYDQLPLVEGKYISTESYRLTAFGAKLIVNNVLSGAVGRSHD